MRFLVNLIMIFAFVTMTSSAMGNGFSGKTCSQTVASQDVCPMPATPADSASIKKAGVCYEALVATAYAAPCQQAASHHFAEALTLALSSASALPFRPPRA